MYKRRKKEIRGKWKNRKESNKKGKKERKKRKERKGKERKGKERKGKERKGKEEEKRREKKRKYRFIRSFQASYSAPKRFEYGSLRKFFETLNQCGCQIWVRRRP